MREQIQQLLSELNSCDLDAGEADVIYCNISWFYEGLQQYKDSLRYIEKALASQPSDGDILWRKTKITKQLRVCEAQRCHMREIVPLAVGQSATIQLVKRLHVDEVSGSDFFTDFALTHTPLIVTGLGGSITRVPWTLDYIRSIAGSCTVTTKVPVAESVEWAKLEPCSVTTVGQFIDRLLAAHPGDKQYLFDWSLPLHCPRLAEDIVIPKYFANDFLQRTPPASLYQDSWPSLFVAPPDITSELHIDSFASNFWMALFQGTKRWTFYKKEDLAFLYPKYYESMDAVFDVDLSDPDPTTHPLLQLVTPFQCVLQPGEVLFVPAGCPHRVENLDVSVAISANYVDASNFAAVKEELRVDGLVNPRAHELFTQFCDPKFDSNMYAYHGDVTWCEFKGREGQRKLPLMHNSW